MGEVGGGKKALIIVRRQAKPSGEMEAVIVAGTRMMGRLREKVGTQQCGPVGPPYSASL